MTATAPRPREALDPALIAEARRLAELPPHALPRIGADLLAWLVIAELATRIGHPAAIAAAAWGIGFFCQHDLLIFGHEAVHRLVSRSRVVNEVALVLIHALFGVSGTAHRRFHYAHHRWTHEDRDPEWWVLRRLGGVGPSYLVLPLVAPAGVMVWTWWFRPGDRLRMVAEMAVSGAIHAALIAVLGPVAWATWIVLPMAIGLVPAFVLRSVTEHHFRVRGDPWRNAGTLDTHVAMRRLWSNIHLHLEHHLFPTVPARYLPALRQALAPAYAARGVAPSTGWLRTFAAFVRIVPHHRAE